MIGRDEILKELREHVKHKQSVLILGKKGIGKTTLLKYIAENTDAIYIEFSTTKPILEAIINHLDVPTDKNIRYLTAQELLETIRPYLKKKKLVLLLDEAESITKYCGRILDKLAEEDVIFIGASEKRVWNYRFRQIIELLPLTNSESNELSKNQLFTLSTPLIIDLIKTKSLGIPGKIKEICKDIKVYHETQDLDKDSQKSVFNFFKDVKPEFPDRINILPIWMLFVIGFGFLLMRYFFYNWGDYNEGYLVAMFGYTSLIIYRLVMVGKHEK